MTDHTYRTFKGFPAEIRQQRFRRQNQSDRAAARQDVQTQRLAQQLAHWMDTAFEVPVVGWRFGWDALLGLLPGVGDAATTLVALYIVALAGKAGVPRVTIARMGLNVAIDMIVGSLPLVGDLFDVYWKANLRNAALLEERLADPAIRPRGTSADWVFVVAVLAGLGVLFVSLVALMAMVVAALWNLALG